MKTKQNFISLVLVVMCLLGTSLLRAQISPPGTYTTLPNNNSVQTTTLNSSVQWFKYTTDSANTGLCINLMQNGSQYSLTKAELYMLNGSSLDLMFTDSLRPDSTIRGLKKNLAPSKTFFIKITSRSTSCGTCTGPLYPVVTLNVFAWTVGCSGYMHPTCQVVRDGAFEYSSVPCNLATYNLGDPCSNGLDVYAGFNACFWNIPYTTGVTAPCPLTYPYAGTSDYYCGTGAHGGSGYAGIFFYSQTTVGAGYAERNYREYITQQLHTPLIAGKTYTMSLWVKRWSLHSFATSNIQVAFSNNTYTTNGAAAIVSPAGQIVNMTSNIITAASWVQLSVSFVANANYSNMTIGNFLPVGSSNVANQNTAETDVNKRGAYYFIDDVSIRPINSITVTPNPLSMCVGSTATLTASMLSPGTYSWQPWSGPDPSLTMLSPDNSVVSVSPANSLTYLVQGWDAIGCYAYTHATVSIIPQPTVSVAPNTAAICGSGTASLTASGASTYTWSTGANTATVTLTPTATTVYTVTGTTGACPPSTATATVNVYPTLTVTASPNVITCPGANTMLTVSGGSGSYLWQPGGATTATAIVSPSVATTYTVTSAAPGCTLSANVLVNPVSCCSVASALTFTATQGNLNGGTFNLNSPLTLTSDLTLDNVTIFMGTNAEIIVPNNVKFRLNQCHLLGCPQMWKGIRFTGPNGTMEITKNSLIEDAITAVDLRTVTAPYNASDIFFIEASTFNKNYTAISVANYNATSGDYPMHLADNVFTSRQLFTADHRLVNPALTITYNWPATSTSSLKGFASIPNTFTPDLHLQTGYQFSVASYSTANMEVPHAGNVGHQGIRVENVYSTTSANGFRMTAYEATPYVYDDFNPHNVFDNLHYGVNAENSNVVVAHGVFQNMQQFVAGTTGVGKPIKYYDGGIGINSISTMAVGLPGTQTFSLTVAPIITGYNKSTNFFFNNPYGVKTENIQYMLVGFNVFHSNRVYTPTTLNQFNAPVGKGEYGVYVKSFDYRGIYVKRNFAANLGTGIVFIANANPIIFNLQAQLVGTVNIQNNTLKANYGASITAGQSMNLGIAADNILSPTAIPYVNGSIVPVVVSNNTIDKAFNGISASNWNHQRILDNSNIVILADNGIVAKTQYGIMHKNNLGDNLVSNNVKGFNTSKSRVYGIFNAENKAQSLWCNYTENSYNGVAFGGSQNLTSWKQNTMLLHQRAMLLDNTTIGQQGASGQPINNTWSGTWTGAYKLYVNGMDPGTPGGNSKLYLSNLPAATESDASPSLFKYKTSAPQSLFYTTGSSGVSCPYNPVGLAPVQLVGYQENLDDIVHNAYAYNSYENSNRKNGKIAVYRALMEDSTLLASDTALVNFRNASKVGNIGKFLNIEKALSEANYGDADVQISAISPVDSAELGLKKMYRIYLRTKNGTYSSTDESDLIDLANSCPRQMGVGVYQARVLLNSLYDVYFQYENNCGNVDNPAYRKGNFASESAEESKGTFTVFPNPSNGLIYFTAANMGIENFTISVYNIHGKIIFKKDYSDGEGVNTLDLKLENGVYFMQLVDQSKGDQYNQKFVIQK